MSSNNSTFSSLATLSVAALLAANTALAQDVPTPAEAAPEPAPVAAPAPAPAPEVQVPVATPIAAAVPEPAPAAKPAALAIAVGGAKVSLYGFAQLNAIWEDGVTSTTAPNWSYFAPKDNDKGGTRTLLNVNHTRIGINFSDAPTEGGTELSGKIETDFNNSNARNNNGAGGFRIRHSYGQVKFGDIGLALLFGQTSDVISPRDPAVLSEGAGNYAGNIGTRRPQIRLTQSLGIAEIALAALDDRGADAPKFPSVQGRIGLKVPAGWAGEKQNLEFGVSGLFAQEKNTDITENQPDIKIPKSWSVNADLNLPIIDILGLSGEFFYGQNLKNYSNGSIGLDRTSTPDSLGGIKSIGGWVNLGVKLPASLSFNGGLGLENIINDDDLKSGTRSSNTGIFANLRYNFIPNAYLGIEYWHISTDYTDDTDGTINRIELAFNYSFK